MPKWWFFTSRKWKARKPAPPPPPPPQSPTPPPPAIPEPHFSPVTHNKERRDQIANALVMLAIGDPDDDSYDTFIPVINLRAHQGSYCLLFESTLMKQREDESPFGHHVLSFPDDSEVVPVPTNAMETNTFQNKEGQISLTVLSCKTELHRCAPIKFGGKVVVGQKLFLYDLRYGAPSLVDGHVTCVGSDAFVLDANSCDDFVNGALVFDEENKLVGVVYHHVGSPVAVNIDRLEKLLLRIFPGNENMYDFYQSLEQM